VSRHEPMFNVPGAVLALLGVLVGVHAVLAILPEDWGSWLTVALAFVPARYAGFAAEIPGGEVASATSFLTYGLVHGDWFHLAINAAWLVAFGGAVANRVGATRFLLFSVFTSIAAALTFLVFNWGLWAPMVGASGAVSGLMGGTMRFMFAAIDGGGFRTLREEPWRVPLTPLAGAITDGRVLLVTGVFVVANFLAILGLGGVSEGGIAWQAHLGGYFSGLLTFGFFDRSPRFHSSQGSMLN
jgi:membrane associated rhomboid family serine protease